MPIAWLTDSKQLKCQQLKYGLSSLMQIWSVSADCRILYKESMKQQQMRTVLSRDDQSSLEHCERHRNMYFINWHNWVIIFDMTQILWNYSDRRLAQPTGHGRLQLNGPNLKALINCHFVQYLVHPLALTHICHGVKHEYDSSTKIARLRWI